MKTYRKGSKVSITFTGTVEDSTVSHLSVKRDGCNTFSYFTDKEFSNVAGPHIEVLKEAFDPKPGEVYLLKSVGPFTYSSEWTTWFCFQKSISGPVEMASQAGVFSLKVFTDAYIDGNGDFELVKAEVKPEK